MARAWKMTLICQSNDDDDELDSDPERVFEDMGFDGFATSRENRGEIIRCALVTPVAEVVDEDAIEVAGLPRRD